MRYLFHCWKEKLIPRTEVNQIHSVFFVSRGSSISIVSDYGLDGQVPTPTEDFSPNLFVQNDSGAHPASYTMGIGGSLSGGKAQPGRDADHSPPSSAEFKKE
jgi:hypothetical protein